MPKISEFYGIAIYFYYRDHAPPHFHAIYADDEALISIDPFQVVEGRLPPRALALVREWQSRHVDELTRAWRQARANQPIDPIEPLE